MYMVEVVGKAWSQMSQGELTFPELVYLNLLVEYFMFCYTSQTRGIHCIPLFSMI